MQTLGGPIYKYRWSDAGCPRRPPGPAAVDVSLRTASAHKYSVRAPQPIPGAFESEAKHQDSQEHQLLVSMDHAVAQYGLAKCEHAQRQPPHACDQAVRVSASPEVGAAPDAGGERSQSLERELSRFRQEGCQAQ